MESETNAVILDKNDNVAIAVKKLQPGEKTIYFGGTEYKITVKETIPVGHKVALCNISSGNPIIKYGTVIGVAINNIAAGHWVHIHNMKSMFDERSSNIDPITGAPGDTPYI